MPINYYPSLTENLDKLSFEYYIQNPKDKTGFHYFLNHLWDFQVIEEDGKNDPIKLYYEYLDHKYSPKIVKDKKLVFITIQDFKRRIDDLDKLKLFMKNIEHIFEECTWCIESGSQPLPNSNLHIHMLAKYVNSKKGKNMLCIQWAKLFDTNLRDKDYFHIKQHRDVKGMPSYKDWILEKKDYFLQEMKGGHKNVIDLDCRGEWGA